MRRIANRRSQRFRIAVPNRRNRLGSDASAIDVRIANRAIRIASSNRCMPSLGADPQLLDGGSRARRTTAYYGVLRRTTAYYG
eukprot:13696137-Alexandrium_andersonii.AAC.1